MERSDNEVGFYFVLRWIRHEIASYEQCSQTKQYNKNNLLGKIIEQKEKQGKEKKSDRLKQHCCDLQSVDQLLAMCYF